MSPSSSITVAALALILELSSTDAGASGPKSAEVKALEQRADELGNAEHDGEAARVWTAVARRDDITAEQHAIATLRTVASARRAFERDADPQHLCLAHAVLDEFLDRDDARAEDVDHLRPFVPKIEEELVTATGTEWKQTCEPSPLICAPAETPRSHVRKDRRNRPRAPVACERPQLDPVARRLTIAGATTMAVGSAALVGMSAALVGANRHVNAIHDLTDAAIKNNGATDEMRQEALDRRDQAEALENVAIALGVTGGATVVTGIVLLAVGQRKQLESFSVTPVATHRYAGFVLTGRF